MHLRCLSPTHRHCFSSWNWDTNAHAEVLSRICRSHWGHPRRHLDYLQLHHPRWLSIFDLARHILSEVAYMQFHGFLRNLNRRLRDKAGRWRQSSDLGTRRSYCATLSWRQGCCLDQNLIGPPLTSYLDPRAFVSNLLAIFVEVSFHVRMIYLRGDWCGSSSQITQAWPHLFHDIALRSLGTLFGLLDTFEFLNAQRSRASRLCWDDSCSNGGPEAM